MRQERDEEVEGTETGGEERVTALMKKKVSYGITVLIVTYMRSSFISSFESTDLMWVKCVFNEFRIIAEKNSTFIISLSLYLSQSP